MVTGLFRNKDKQLILPVSAYLAAKSLDWLIGCREDSACLGVFVNHDPTVTEREIELTLK